MIPDQTQPDNSSAWIPENVSDEVTGEVTGIERHLRAQWGYPQKEGDPEHVYVITLVTAENVVREVWGWHTTLHGELLKVKPKIRETVTVRVSGTGVSKQYGRE